MSEKANNNHADLLRELSQAAIQLRGSVEPSDYKRYVLPLVFLRFLSLRFDVRREELQVLLKDPGSDLFTDDPKLVRETLADPDEYRAAGVFMVPEKARWNYIRERAQADDVKVMLEQAEALYRDWPRAA